MREEIAVFTREVLKIAYHPSFLEGLIPLADWTKTLEYDLLALVRS